MTPVIERSVWASDQGRCVHLLYCHSVYIGTVTQSSVLAASLHISRELRFSIEVDWWLMFRVAVRENAPLDGWWSGGITLAGVRLCFWWRHSMRRSYAIDDMCLVWVVESFFVSWCWSIPFEWLIVVAPSEYFPLQWGCMAEEVSKELWVDRICRAVKGSCLNGFI